MRYKIEKTYKLNASTGKEVEEYKLYFKTGFRDLEDTGSDVIYFFALLFFRLGRWSYCCTESSLEAAKKKLHEKMKVYLYKEKEPEVIVEEEI